MKTALPFHVEWEDERAEMLTCDIDNGVSDNPVIIYVAYTGRSAALADYNHKFDPRRDRVFQGNLSIMDLVLSQSSPAETLLTEIWTMRLQNIFQVFTRPMSM